MDKRKPCIAMVPCPGFGHVIPLIAFAKRLVVGHPHLHVTLFIPTLGPPSPTTYSLLQSLPPHIDFTIPPPVNQNDIPESAVHLSTQIHQTVILSLPSLGHALSLLSSQTHLVAMIVDMFSVDALEIAKQFNLKSYVYYTSGATSLCFCLNFPQLDQDHDMVSTGFLDLSQPLKLPGCVAFQGKDLPDSVQERETESYKTMLHICKQFIFADGIFVNSFLELEREVITALQEERNHGWPPIYPVGPILQAESSSARTNESTLEYLKWLDNQPRNSVLYVCFGSGGTLSREQLHELALALEMSGQKFLWVVRAPSEYAFLAYLCAEKVRVSPLDYLPEGFLERTKGQGLLVPSWAPQTEVLRRDSVGGFLTRCGWNSTLESVFYGKPMIAWPLFAEQRMNSVLLTEELKIAVRPKENENNDGIVEKEEVSRIVKSVMEDDDGREISSRIQVFKDAAANALSEHGSSTLKLSHLFVEWKITK